MDFRDPLDGGKFLHDDFIKLKDCALYGGDFYKKWERKDLCGEKARSKKFRKSAKEVPASPLASKPVTSRSHLPQSDTPFQSGKNTPNGSIQKACSSLCRHGPKAALPQIKKKPKKQFNYVDRHLLKISETIPGDSSKSLIQIKASNKAIEQYKSICTALKDQNMILKDAICDVENSTFSKVHGYLDTYTRCKKISSCIETDHGGDIQTVSSQYESSKHETEKEITAMAIEVNAITKKVEKTRQYIESLLSYKNEIYPKQETHIKELEDFVKKTKQIYADEISSLAEISNNEKKNYEDAAVMTKHLALLQISQGTVDTVDEDILNLAVENRRLEESIKKLLIEETNLQSEIKSLEDSLKTQDLVSVTRDVFPDVVINRPECLPNDIVKLRGTPLLKVYPI